MKPLDEALSRSASREVMMRRLREQERARLALERVRERQRLNDKEKKKYRQEVQSLPARILTSGLGQTLAFFASRKGKEGRPNPTEYLVGNDLVQLLTRDEKGDSVDYLDGLMRKSVAEYRRETREALALAEWLKRYSAALMPKEEDEE